MINTITKSRININGGQNPNVLTNLRDDISEVLQESDSSIQLVATETEDANYIILRLDTDGDAGIYLKLLVSDDNKLYIQYSNVGDPDGDWATIAQYMKVTYSYTYGYISASITAAGDIILYGTYLTVNSSDNSVTNSITTPILALTSAISATKGNASKMLIVWAAKNTMSTASGAKYASIIPRDANSMNGYSPWILVSKDVTPTNMYNLINFQLESDVGGSSANAPYFKKAMWSTTGYKGLTVLSPLYTPGSTYVSATTRLIEYTDAKYDGYCIFNNANYYVVNGVAFLDNSVSSNTYTEDEIEEEEEDMEDITIEDIEEP